MACEFFVAVKAKLMLIAIHCLLYFVLLYMYTYGLSALPFTNATVQSTEGNLLVRGT